MKKLAVMSCLATLLAVPAGQALAHFGMVIPEQHIIDQEKKETTLTLSFSHPFENVGMDLSQPKNRPVLWIIRHGRLLIVLLARVSINLSWNQPLTGNLRKI